MIKLVEKDTVLSNNLERQRKMVESVNNVRNAFAQIPQEER
jgi:hypothetical protein